MYKLTLISFAFSFLVLPILVLPILAAPVPVPDEIDGPEKRTTTFSGRGTYYYPGLGACDITNKDSDPVVAISTKMYGDGHNCRKKVLINNLVTAQIVDKCPSCHTHDLDLSPTVFEKLAPLSKGVVGVNWHFV